ncbi:ABC transporter substrate-binding protein [Blastococcus deserti]|uniref:ABC transporter substrate-binding protein n=1 Tax=Blastococcus deserti TaxID=2259033 RepID=A0ABW4XEW9_9ACTN
MRRRTAALMAAPLLLAVACGGAEDADVGAGVTATEELEEVTVGVIPTVDVAPLYLGEEKGFFADQGIDLTFEAGRGGATIVPGVINGQYDIGFSNMVSLLQAAEQELPLELVGSGVASTGVPGADFAAVVVLPSSGITDAAGLADKRIAVNTRNNIGTTTVNESIRTAGADPSGVEYVEVPFPDMPEALADGDVDAIAVVEPYLTMATADGAVVVASNLVDAVPGLTVAAYFTSRELATEEPDLVERFTIALEQSLQYASQHGDEARAVLRYYMETEIDQAVLRSMTLPAWPTEFDRSSVQRLADLAIEDGLLTEEPDLDALLP